MSPPVVAESIVAAIAEGTSGLPKTGKQTTGKPSQPFAQTAALANARQASQTDNTGTDGTSEVGSPPADKSAPITGASSGVASAADSRKTQGQTAESVEILVAQTVGWVVQTNPGEVRLVEGQPPKGTTSPEAPGAKTPSRQSARFVSSGAARLPAGSTCPAAQVSPAKEPGESNPVPVQTEGAILPKDGLGSVARQVTVEGGQAVGTVSSRLAGDSHSSQTTDKSTTVVREQAAESKPVEAATGAVSSQLAGDGRTSQTTDKSVTALKGHAAESKQTEAKTTLSQVGEPNVTRAEDRQEQSIPGLEKRVQPEAERVGTGKAAPSAETAHNSQQVIRETPSQGHQSLAAGGDNAPARPATSAGEQMMGPSQLGHSSMVQSEQAAPEAGRSAPVLRPITDQTSTVGGFGDIAAKSTAQSIGEQIRDSMHASLTGGEREVVVRLRPPELGDVLVRFQQENGHIQGVLEVSRGDTRHDVEQALPQVLRDLHDLGIQVRKLDVTVSDQSGSDASRQQMQQEAWSRQQGYDRYAGGTQPPVNAGRLPEGAELQDGTEDYLTSATAAADVPAGRINMLA